MCCAITVFLKVRSATIFGIYLSIVHSTSFLYADATKCLNTTELLTHLMIYRMAQKFDGGNIDGSFAICQNFTIQNVPSSS